MFRRHNYCIDCGRQISARYDRCYLCNRWRREVSWHDEEEVPGLLERDEELGRDEFYVYVLDTKYGHYVGHTGNLAARLRAHRRGESPSTADGDPHLIWKSRRFYSRPDATLLEAQLKSLRDRKDPRFPEIIGYDAVPFEAPSERRQQVVGAELDLRVIGSVVAIGVAIIIAVLIALSSN